MTLSHYTINTGHCRMSPRGGVTEHAIRALDPLVTAGGGWVPLGEAALGFRIIPNEDGERWLACLAWGTPRESVTFATMILAWGENAADAAWAAILRIAEEEKIPVADNGGRPAEVPLLAVLLHASVAAMPRELLMAAADLERCIAWTILAQHGLAP